MKSRIRLLVAMLGCSAVAVVGCSTATDSPASSTPTTVASAAEQQEVSLIAMAASSTRVLNDDLDALLRTQLPQLRLAYNNAGTSTLVQQIRDGAPADVLISANKKHMDTALAEGLVSDPHAVATNTMVMVVPKGNPGGIHSIADLEGAAVVLCDVQVPCGDISRSLQEANNIVLTPVSLEHAVGDVLGKVVSGEADAGWVYRTDAAAALRSGDTVEVIEIPHADEFANTLMAAAVTDSAHPDQAAQVVALLSGPDAVDLWESHGFTPVASVK